MSTKPAWSNDARTGPVRRFQQLVVFACEGLIAVCDERHAHLGEFTVVTPVDMERRVRGVARPYRNKTKSEMTLWQRQEHDAVMRGCAALAECIKEAKEMGDPSDPAVQAYWRRHRRQSTISLSAGSDAKGYPTLPNVDLGPVTGRTERIDGIATVPLGAHSKHHPPRKKTPGRIIEL